MKTAILKLTATTLVATATLFAGTASGAIVVNDSAVGGGGSREGSGLGSFTTTEDTDLLLVGNAGFFTEGAASAMTFNSKSLTEVPDSRASYSSGHETVFFYLLNPGAHTGAIDVTRAGKDWSDTDEIVAFSISGAFASDHISAYTAATGSGDSLSLTESVPGRARMAIDLLAVELNSGINPTAMSGQTVAMDAIASDNDGKFNKSSYKSISSSAVTMGWDFGTATVDRGAAYTMLVLEIPEPATAALFALAGVALLRRRRR